MQQKMNTDGIEYVGYYNISFVYCICCGFCSVFVCKVWLNKVRSGFLNCGCFFKQTSPQPHDHPRAAEPSQTCVVF